MTATLGLAPRLRPWRLLRRPLVHHGQLHLMYPISLDGHVVAEAQIEVDYRATYSPARPGIRYIEPPAPPEVERVEVQGISVQLMVDGDVWVRVDELGAESRYVIREWVAGQLADEAIVLEIALQIEAA